MLLLGLSLSPKICSVLPCTNLYGPTTILFTLPVLLTLNKVRVGHDELIGEVIRINADQATIQVYEETGMPYRQS